LVTPKSNKYFRKSRIKINRAYSYPVRRMSMKKGGAAFKRRRLAGPVGVKFESDGLLHSIFEEYVKSSEKRAETRQSKTRSQKTKESRLKRESHKTTIREQSRRKKGITAKPKPKPKPKPTPREVEMSWEEESPEEVQEITFQAQCYNCYGMMDVPYDDEAVVVNCPSCGSKNMFRDSPAPEKKQTSVKEDVESWFVESESDGPSWGQQKKQVDEKAVSMNEYGKKLLDQGFYKAAIYWFDQALTQDPNYKQAKQNRNTAQKMLDSQTNKDFNF